MIHGSPYHIRDAAPNDARLMVHALRKEDREEITCLGLRPLRTLKGCYGRSAIRRTAFLGDEIAAMWGMSGPLLLPVGEPWLLTSPAVERKPIAFAKQMRRELMAMLAIKPMLRGYVAASYSRAVGLLELLGFEVGPPEPFGAARVMFREYVLRGTD